MKSPAIHVSPRLSPTLPQAIAVICVFFVYAVSLPSLKATPAYPADDMETLKHIHSLDLREVYDLPATVRSVAWKSMEHGPLYFAALNIWQGVGGHDLFAARLLSVYFGALAVAAVWRVGRSCGDRELACGGAIALACLAFFVHFAHTARMYSLLALLACWLMWSYWRVAASASRPSWRRWISLFLATASIVYTHYFGFLLIAAIGCYHLLIARKDRRWLFAAAAMAAGCLTFVGWLPVALRGFERSRETLAATRLPIGEALAAILSVSANGLWIAPVVAFAAALFFRRHLRRGEVYLLFVAAATLAGFALLNEIVPILVDIRMRYVIVLTVPMCCALPIGLRRLPGWRAWRWLLVPLAIASFFAYAGSEDLFVYSARRHFNTDHKTNLQAFIYEAERFPGSGQLILSMSDAAQWNENGYPTYYRAQVWQRGYADLAFIGYDDGQLWINSGLDKFATLAGIVENAPEVWVIHNPAAVDLDDLAFYRDWFLPHYHSCGAYLDEPRTVISHWRQSGESCEPPAASN